MPQNFQIIDNKKYMWDGKVYESRPEAEKTAEVYKKADFDIQMIEEDGKCLLYTRREAAATT